MPFTETFANDSALFPLFADYLTYLLHLERAHKRSSDDGYKSAITEALSKSLERAEQSLLKAVHERYDINRLQWIHHAAQVVLDRHTGGPQFFLDRLMIR